MPFSRFFILGFIPSLLAILELFTVSLTEDQFTQFTDVNPMTTILVDQFIVLVGFVHVIIFITRPFTKPTYSLLDEINKVPEGDFSA